MASPSVSDRLTTPVVPRRPGTAPLAKALRTWSFHERRTLLVLGDAMLLTLLYGLVTHLFLLAPSPAILPFGAFLVLTYLGSCWLLDLYRQAPYRVPLSPTLMDRLLAHVPLFYALAKASLLAVLVIGTVSFWRGNYFPVQPKALAILALTAILLLWLWRAVFFGVFHFSLGKKRTLVVGAGHTAKDLVRLSQEHPQLGYEIVGYVDDDPRLTGQLSQGVKVHGPCCSLPDLVRHLDCDTVFIGITVKKAEETRQAIADSMVSGVEVLTPPEVYERHFGMVPLHAINHSWFIYNLSHTHRGLYVGIKRLIDLLGASAGLLVASPLLVLVALAIKLDSPGPIFYSQIRVGERGKTFRIYKFRSMRTDAEANGAVWAQKDDPRITRLGRFLRKTRLDEIPQLVNVLHGDLSLVGPRPERPEFVEQLKGSIPFYDRRHMVKPGLTGWAQVRFVYGASVQDAFDKLQYDFFYIKNRSLWLDFEIVLRTIWVVLARKGAQ